MEMVGKKVVCVGAVLCMLVAIMVAIQPQGAEAAITCGQVTASLAPCIPYLTKNAPLGGCCAGVQKLNSQAQTTPDRQAACGCLKQAYNSIKGINTALAAGLPAKCGVSIPYKISPDTDCSKVR